MKKKMVKKISGISLLASLFVMAGCGTEEPQSVKVTFVANNSSENQVIEIGAGKTTYAPAVEKEGQVFAGWYTDENLTAEFDFDTVLNSDVTLYAKWVDPDVVTVNVTFDYQCDEINDTTVVIAVDSPAYKPVNPEREGYNFGGWYADADCSLAYDFANVSQDTSIYAKWVKVNTVSFDVDGVEALEVETGKNVVLPEAPLRDGFSFKGWKVADKDTLYQAGDVITIDKDGDLAVTAQYKEVFEVVYYGYNGQVVKSENLEEGSPFANPETAGDVPSYITFTGWNLAEESVNGDIAVYGNYQYNASQDANFTFVGYKVVDDVDENDNPIKVETVAEGDEDAQYYKVKGADYALEESANGILVLPKSYKGKDVVGIIEGTSAAPSFTASFVNADSETVSKGILEVVIPNTYKEVAPYAFYNNGALEKVAFEANSSVKEIGDYAFAFSDWSSLKGNTNKTPEKVQAAKDGMSHLQEISIPASVEVIGKGAFKNAYLVTNMNIQAGSQLRVIGESAFQLANTQSFAVGGSGLSEVYIPATVEEIGKLAFAYNAQSKVVFEEGSVLKVIGEQAFAQSNNSSDNNQNEVEGRIYNDNRNNLASIVIPASVEEIGNKAFYMNYALTKVEFEEGSAVTKIGSEAFSTAKVLESVVLPESLAEIGSKAFYQTALVSITIPGSVTTIGDSAFSQVYTLKELVFAKGSEPLTIGASAFAGSPSSSSTGKGTLMNIEKVVIPARCTSIGEKAFIANQLNSLEFEEGGNGLAIGKLAFAAASSTSGVYGYSDISSVKFPAHINTIGEQAFLGQFALTSVVVPSEATLTSIGKQAFYACPNIAIITLNEGLQEIKQQAFASTTTLSILNNGAIVKVDGVNDSLADIVIPSTVTNIEQQAFNFCSDIKTITFTPTATGAEEVDLTIGTNAFFCGGSYYNTSLKTLTIPARVTSIGTSAFGRYQAMTSLTFGANSKCATIGNNAFQDCKALTSVVLPATLSAYSGQEFTGCEALASFDIQEGSTVYSAVDGVLYSFDGTELVAIPSAKLATMTEFNAPDALLSIGDLAFSGAEKLAKVNLTNVTTVGVGAFKNCSNLEEVVMNNVVRVENDAFRMTYANNIAESKLAKLTAPKLEYIGNYGFYATKLTSFDLSKVTYIGNNAFWRVPLANVDFCEDLTYIGSNAFQYSNISEVYVPSKVGFVGGSAFANCEKLEKVYIKATNVNYDIYSTKSGYTDVKIATYNHLQMNATVFNNCSALKYISIEGKVAGFNTSVKVGTVSNLVGIYVHGDYPFADYQIVNSTSVDSPEKVTWKTVNANTYFSACASKITTWDARPEEAKFDFEKPVQNLGEEA